MSAPGRTQIYSSPRMQARRRRILTETRRLLIERGLEDFQMGEVCERADVAKRTLYNAFQSKDQLIAAAIEDYLERFLETLHYRNPTGSLDRILERLILIHRRNREIRNYAQAVMAIYFAAAPSSGIWRAIHSLAMDANLEWIRQVATQGELAASAEPEVLADDLAHYEYSIINSWCQGWIDDEAFVPRLVSGYLTYAAGALRGRSRSEAEDKLLRIRRGVAPEEVLAEPAPANAPLRRA